MALHPAPLYILGLGLLTASPRGLLSERLTPALAHPALAKADVLIGGKAQLSYFPEHAAERIVIEKDLSLVLKKIAKNREMLKVQVVLCSGDPLFFSIGARICEHFGTAGLHFLPGMSSLQAAAALVGLPWEQVRSVSLLGSPSFLPFAQALLTRDPVFIITSPSTTPASIAKYMVERGCAEYTVHMLENMQYNPHSGNLYAERHLVLSPYEALLHDDAVGALTARVFLLDPRKRETQRITTGMGNEGQTPFQKEQPRGLFGLTDTQIVHKDNLFAKSPVRAAGLAALGIAPHHTVWDLGAGSGAVGMEAAFLAHRGQVIAVEGNAERVEFIARNRALFGVANLDIMHGTMPECFLPLLQAMDESASPSVPLAEPVQNRSSFMLTRPHRVFLGGGLSGTTELAAEILTVVWQALLPGGRLVIHCILLEHFERARHFLQSLQAEIESMSIQVSQSRAPGRDSSLESTNMVFLLIARKNVSTTEEH